MSEEDKAEAPERVKKAFLLINQWKETHKLKDGVSINFEDAESK